MKKELKRSIKEDEFVSGVQVAWDWLREHQDEARVSAAVLALVIVGGVILKQYRDTRSEKASTAYTAALEVFHAPLQSELPAGTKPSGPVFETANQRYGTAGQAFEELADDYPNQPLGRRALYYSGLSKLELGQLDDAEKELRTVESWANQDPLLAGLAKLALGEVQQRQGNVDAAVVTWREVADDTNSPVPRDYALMCAARALELSNRFEEARASYEQVVDRFPDSVYLSQARQRAVYLSSAG